MAALLRTLYCLSVQFGCVVSAVHLPGVDNTWADCLSRGWLEKFYEVCPGTAPFPTAIGSFWLDFDNESDVWVRHPHNDLAEMVTQGLNRERLPGGCLAGTPEGEHMVEPLAQGGVDHSAIDQSRQLPLHQAGISCPSQKASVGDAASGWQGAQVGTTSGSIDSCICWHAGSMVSACPFQETLSSFNAQHSNSDNQYMGVQQYAGPMILMHPPRGMPP